MSNSLKTLKGLNVVIHGFYGDEPLIPMDRLCEAALYNITKFEKQREKLSDCDREHYHLLTGHIWALREFFNLEVD